MRDNKVPQDCATGVSMPHVELEQCLGGCNLSRFGRRLGCHSQAHPGPLLPAPSQDGGWSGRAVTSSEASHWLRAILSGVTSAVMESQGILLRAPLLDWCGKYGLSANPVRAPCSERVDHVRVHEGQACCPVERV